MLQNRKPPSGRKEGMADVRETGMKGGATFKNQQHVKVK